MWHRPLSTRKPLENGESTYIQPFVTKTMCPFNPRAGLPFNTHLPKQTSTWSSALVGRCSTLVPRRQSSTRHKQMGVNRVPRDISFCWGAESPCLQLDFFAEHCVYTCWVPSAMLSPDSRPCGTVKQQGLRMQPVETWWGASSRPTWVGRAIVVCLQNLFQTVACLLLRVGKGLLPIILTQDTDCTCLLMANSSLRTMPIRQLRALLKPFILVITTDSIVLWHPDVPQFQV